MRAIVYVEGPSDRFAMEALLAPLLEAKCRSGTAISFIPSSEGDRKATLLTKTPVKAANTLLNDPEAVVALIPDLYPPNKGFAHETFAQLQAGIMQRFRDAVARRGGGADTRLEARFRVFCFKHDLEALLLACPDGLACRLGLRGLTATWTTPVEDQDHGKPPKRVVEELFLQHGKRYQDTVDASVILSGQDRAAVANACPQCFKPFVEWLEGL